MIYRDTKQLKERIETLLNTASKRAEIDVEHHLHQKEDITTQTYIYNLDDDTVDQFFLHPHCGDADDTQSIASDSAAAQYVVDYVTGCAVDFFNDKNPTITVTVDDQHTYEFEYRV